jgi:NAD(P)-dependent dehydrogenase (short-subunit alcohol dehydrogenase family)
MPIQNDYCEEKISMNRFFEMFSLENKVIVITGASEGIGRDLSIGLASVGANIVLCSRREDKLQEVKKEIEKTGRRGEIFALDVRCIKDIEGLRSFVLDKFGRIDGLINNAGFAVTKPAWEITESDWDGMTDTGFKALFFCCQILGSAMRDQKYGKIINVSSTLSRSTAYGRAVYGALKAGVSRLTEALAVEWASSGIRVNALAPTAVKTPSREEVLTGELLQRVLNRIPLGRLATSEDLIGAAIYLASPASDFVTGQTLFVDGGWVAAG